MKKGLTTVQSKILVLLLAISFLFACSKEDVKPDESKGPLVDLSIASTLDITKPDIDGLVTYTLTARNNGPKDATEVIVTDILPEGVVMESSTTLKGTYDDKTGKWTIGDLTKDASCVLTIKAKVISYGSITNTAQIDGKVTDTNLQNNSTKTSLFTNLVGLSKEQLWSFEIYAAMQEIYLWNDALPKAFDPRKYATPENTLDYLSLLKINPETTKPIDRYSFLDKIGGLSGEIGGGVASGDYGFMVTAGLNAANQVSFFVTYVYKESPAGLAGIERSFEIIKINGSEEVHPEVDKEGYLIPSSPGYTNMINSLFKSEAASFTFKRSNGTTLDVSLQVAKTEYPINSVLYENIYTVGSSKVGYMVFNQFLGQSSQTEISNVINKFESNGVQYLIVDLRYNGGGSVETCEKFCNLIAPKSANGKAMYSYKMNPGLTEYYISKNYRLTSNFNKSNSFEPKKIYFIVGGGTASASELLINNLRPYYSSNLYLIGATTYGKPCGFWATPIGYSEDQTTPKEGYDLYAVSFESVNANNEGGYYAGMTPGSTKYPGIKAGDSYNLSWGDVNDARLAQALNHISKGSFKATTKSAVKQPICDIDRQFKGMIDFRKH